VPSPCPSLIFLRRSSSAPPRCQRFSAENPRRTRNLFGARIGAFCRGFGAHLHLACEALAGSRSRGAGRCAAFVVEIFSTGPRSRLTGAPTLSWSESRGPQFCLAVSGGPVAGLLSYRCATKTVIRGTARLRDCRSCGAGDLQIRRPAYLNILREASSPPRFCRRDMLKTGRSK